MGAEVPTIIMGPIIAMATPSNIGSDRWLAPAYVLTRGFFWLLGGTAIVWAMLVLPVFRQQAPLHLVASELLKGRSYKVAALSADQKQAAEFNRNSFCNPTALHDAVVLGVAVLQNAIGSKSPALINSEYTDLNNLTRAALACWPADSFAWLTLFWLDTGTSGITPENLRYLRLSYSQGPNEGWIALWRDQVALPFFYRLPNELQKNAMEDFVKLVDTKIWYREAAVIFAGVAPDVQKAIAEQLVDAQKDQRRTFAHILLDRGFRTNIPGVTS